jgi:hypothetical protein
MPPATSCFPRSIRELSGHCRNEGLCRITVGTNLGGRRPHRRVELHSQSTVGRSDRRRHSAAGAPQSRQSKHHHHRSEDHQEHAQPWVTTSRHMASTKSPFTPAMQSCGRFWGDGPSPRQHSSTPVCRLPFSACPTRRTTTESSRPAVRNMRAGFLMCRSIERHRSPA